ncbi:hypothetical protein HHK36_004745 [Tetracentron sinense]|uniref:Uncharacterized protein n=1 Tax=Tetracentron sinense TaxID=13715 RepID=A0A834ZU91_TETSI|nr:hypothetical protein HHK36_004745 [Tetracentron sinense]
MKSKVTLLSPSVFAIFLCFSCLIKRSQAQATTDPSEVRVLNSIFQKWNITAGPLWNISGEPCSGAAIDGTNIDEWAFNPAIICNCDFENRSTCHITYLCVSLSLSRTR